MKMRLLQTTDLKITVICELKFLLSENLDKRLSVN